MRKESNRATVLSDVEGGTVTRLFKSGNDYLAFLIVSV
jgi:hypothetical protein